MSKKGKEQHGKPAAGELAGQLAVSETSHENGADPVSAPVLSEPALPAGEAPDTAIPEVDGLVEGAAEPAGAHSVEPVAPAGEVFIDGQGKAWDQAGEPVGGDDGQAAQTLGESADGAAAPGSGDPDGPLLEYPLDAGIPTDNDAAVQDPETGDASGVDPAGGSGGTPPPPPPTLADLAAFVARAAGSYATGQSHLQGLASEDSQIMAEFVRDNPDAPIDALPIHLALKKREPRRELSAVDRFALTMFRTACLAAIAFDKEQGALQPQPAPPAGGWPGKRAFDPEPGPFAATGFSARR